ncbi:DUF2849 domain-containing protein [Curvivirga aplysinae]|uniref:DUF2849 domain-containing protein n=1 Tax=Curvivirga aplysinae TaxID=2529852 RepID=UPI0012BB762E|nr:DUF2849 domain-containing protein [Curvivirga aplysinae]MTI09037.1 DUF2849 domain-containing protein [Curvivirga aplysinae]
MSAHILTANHLIEGGVVYLTADNEWSGSIADARIANSEEELAAITEEGQLALTNNKVVDPHTVPVSLEGNFAIPTHVKERIRAKGPTIHPQFGKQAEIPAIAENIATY